MSNDEGRHTEDEQEAKAPEEDKPAMPPGARAVAETDKSVDDEDKSDGA
jgi:hypothetical protein